MSGVVGAVITDGVGERVWAKVVRRWRVADSTSRKGDAAVRTLGDGDDRQASVERWCQIVGIGVVGQHVDGVVASVLSHGGTVIDCVRCVVDIGYRDVDCRCICGPIAGAVIADGVGERSGPK